MLAAAGVAAVGWRSSVGSMTDYAAYQTRLRAPLPAAATDLELIRYATLAANGHNTQPWRFGLEAGAISIRPDHSRRTPIVDPDDHHLFVSLGCAAENLAIAATATGRPGDLDVSEQGVWYRFSVGESKPDPLLATIPIRQCTRSEYDGRVMSGEDVAALQLAGNMPGVRLILLTERVRISQVRDLVISGNSAQLADPAFVAELKQWLRFNPRDAARAGDGLFSAASGNPSVPGLVGGLAFDQVFTAAGENEKYARQMDTSSAIAVFVAERADPAHWIAVGRACQRLALTATHLGLKHAFVNQPIEVSELRSELADTVGAPGRRPDIVMRLGYAPAMPYSPRRPVGAVIDRAPA